MKPLENLSFLICLVSSALIGGGASAAIVSISEIGLGGDAPAIIAQDFGEDPLSFSDRTHQHKGAAFDAVSGLLSITGTDIVPLPSYLVGHDYVRFANNVRDQSGYSATVTTDVPSLFYLLLDNRINGPAGDISSSNDSDPVLGGSFQWVIDGGWQRVNTGISPIGQADYTGVDEGGQAIGPGIGLNQFYSVWTLPHTLNSVTVSNNGAGESNMISLVASPELNPGDQYRLLFVTNSVTNAESADIAVYNALVAADAAAVPELDALGTTWTAVASTPTVDAVDNTMTDPSPAGPTGVPIYLINGRRFADDYDSLWTSGGPLVGGVPIPVGSLPFIPTSSGNSPPLRVWTGSSQLGVEHAAWGGLGDADGDAAIGTPEEGNIIFPSFNWMTFGVVSFTGQFQPNPLYGMSGVLTVPCIENITQGTTHVTIQEAVDSSSAGDVIELGPCIFNERSITLNNRDITLRGAGPSSTIIDGQGMVGSILKLLDGDESTIEGLTIRNGVADVANGGGAVFQVDSTIASTFRDCVFDGNDSGGFALGAVYNARGNALFERCVFRNNTTRSGGLATAVGTLGASTTFIDCLFEGERNGVGVVYYQSVGSPATGSVVNCTFADYDGDSFILAQSALTTVDVVNCAFDASATTVAAINGATATVSSSVFPGATLDNIDGVPTFVDAAGGDYRLAPGSLGIDAADHDAYVAADGGDADLNGNPRLVGCALDMGAYEFQVPQAGPVENVDEGTFHCTIQDCIDNAADFQECVVPPGTYFENITFAGRPITLCSTDPLDPDVVAATIIDAAGSGTVVRCTSGEGQDTILSGFTITRGSGTGGGGMRNVNSSPTVTHCVFTGSISAFGGGMSNRDSSSPTVTSCTFSGNTATADGGGMNNESNSNPIVTDCTFNGNTADDDGGGMHNVDSNPTVTNCTFNANVATSGGGGGMYNMNSSPRVTNCDFSRNSAPNGAGSVLNYGSILSDFIITSGSSSPGGGMFNRDRSSPTVTNCTFRGNTADIGAGMFNFTSSSPTLINCAFSGNTASEGRGGSMYNQGSSNPTLINCTLSGSTANRSGLYNSQSAHPTLTNCILWGASDDEIVNIDDTTTTITYSDVRGSGGSAAWNPSLGLDGGGNIDADPLFVRHPNPGPDGQFDGVDDDYGDLRLLPGSPCIDAADNLAVPVHGPDLDGHTRFANDPATVDTGNPPKADTIVDMGAYEYIAGDGDRDGDTDLFDNEMFVGCMTGPGGDVLPECIFFDMDADGHVGVLDFAVLQNAFTRDAMPSIEIGPFTINGLQEVPTSSSLATGVGSVTLSPDGFLDFNIVFSRLVGAQSGAHFHGPATPDQNAGIQFPLPIGSPVIGSVGPLDAQQQSDLLDGLWYVNIHSTTFPGGEIRGQIDSP